MANYWEKQRRGIRYYAQLIPSGVTIGEHHEEDGHEDGGACNDAQFLTGQFHDWISRELGAETLAEIRAAVQARKQNT